MIVPARNDDCKTPRDEGLFLDGAVAALRDALRDAVKVADEARHREAQARHRLHTYLTLRNKLPPYRQDVEPCAICRVGFKEGEEVAAGIAMINDSGATYGSRPIHEDCGKRALAEEYLAPWGTGPKGVKLYRVEDDAIGIGRWE